MSDRLAQIGLTLVGFLVAFIPVWIYLLVSHLAQPEGFWQKLALGVVGIAALGGIQFMLLILLIMFLSSVWKQ